MSVILVIAVEANGEKVSWGLARLVTTTTSSQMVNKSRKWIRTSSFFMDTENGLTSTRLGEGCFVVRTSG